MALFRNENPNLGPLTTIQELAGFGSGNPIASNFKPISRGIVVSTPIAAASVPSFLFIAPWACQVVSIKATYTTAGGASAAIQLTKVLQAALPTAPNTAVGAGVIALTSATIPLTGTANTTLVGALSTASGSPTVLAAGDQIGFILSGTLTGLVNLIIQVELSQIG